MQHKTKRLGYVKTLLMVIVCCFMFGQTADAENMVDPNKKKKERARRSSSPTRNRRSLSISVQKVGWGLPLLATSRPHAHGRLERVVDIPLQTSEGADHNDPRSKALGHQILETNLTGNGPNGLALVGSFTKLRNQ
jgi:hypothetical protein